MNYAIRHGVSKKPVYNRSYDMDYSAKPGGKPHHSSQRPRIMRGRGYWFASVVS